MYVWLRANNLIKVLERRQASLNAEIATHEQRIKSIQLAISHKEKEQQDLKEQIKRLTPAGVLSRTTMYKIIRRQGVLLSQIHIIADELLQLEEILSEQRRKLEQIRRERKIQDKKHYKVTAYVQKLRRQQLQHHELIMENEVQESVCYAKSY